MGLTEYGYLQVPDDLWAKESSEEEKKFIVAFSSKVRHKEDMGNMNVPQCFKTTINGSGTQKARRKISFNLYLDSLDDEGKEGNNEDAGKGNGCHFLQ
eukprot:11805589-Ditylum_brightwellii.AAC.1